MASGAAAGCGYITVTLRAQYDEETGQYVSRCMELGISSCADDLAKAFDRIVEATSLYLNTLEDVNERERVLSEAGIEIELGLPSELEIPVQARPKEYVSPRNLPLALATV